MINCPQRYYQNADFLRECFEKLGKWIVSCHGKDSLLRNELTVNLQEVRPGMGHLDYGVFLRELNRLPGDLPLILEHLPAEDYSAARGYVVSVAEQNGLSFTKPKGSA